MEKKEKVKEIFKKSLKKLEGEEELESLLDSNIALDNDYNDVEQKGDIFDW